MRRSLALALAVVPAIAAATPYDGVYRQAANADCGLVGVDGGALMIKDGIFHGVDMECRMENPVNVTDMDATLYTLHCSGEDDHWTERALIMNAADSDGIIMLWNGYAFRYETCQGE
ncbi:hypothetical protein BVC71_08645 [Marivivens niveibacter]|uniref:Uncharacterized protein n=1 Tax=Marivivens niveibacter TaxID=1930667 RepID=A0A251WZH3_9RHOB|nr:hypothetical protein [Marivivens niveibacter]OUD09879.1 hypothetical protein BVC71_08645 [Marivivens niveibacter]